MVCPPIRRDNPRALASGLSVVQADELCSIISNVDLARYCVSRAKDLVFQDLLYIYLFIFVFHS